MTLVVDLDLGVDVHRGRVAPPAQDPAAGPDEPTERDAGSLPVGRLLGLASSGSFAAVASLTCFVC